jgi:hypothetical protein
VEIFVNGESVSFSLEKENNLFDIYRSLAGWAETQGLEITDIQVNGNAMNPPEAGEWTAVPLDAIQTVALSAVSRQDRSRRELSVILEYFALLEQTLREEKEAALREVLEEYPYVHESLKFYARDIFAPSAEESRGSGELILRRLGEKEPFTQAEKDSLLEFVRTAGRIIKERLEEIAESGKEASAVAALLLAAKPSIENVPVLLQSGKDREAMRSILSYTELALKAARILSKKSEEAAEVGDFCRELNGVLTELADAFRARDSVLIGDLFEYEIAPRTDRLAELLQGGA